MKHIVDDPQTRRILKISKDKTVITNFFFDHRAGNAESNNETGLIKTFIAQLCQRIPKVEEKLAILNAYHSIQDRSLESLYELLKDALRAAEQKVYAFIDGLDEFRGDYSILATTLLRLQQKTSLRICFASRSEQGLIRVLSNVPSLQMQDHNAASVQAYIQYVINLAEDSSPGISSAIDNDMRHTITRRANGMIIWARLVMEQLLRAAAERSSQEHLNSILDQLPDVLEQMYDQTLARFEVSWRSEAALLLYFINECGGSVEGAVVFGFWDFFYVEILGGLPNADVTTLDRFLRRIRHRS